MSTLCESLRAKAVIVLLGIPLLSSSHVQELMGHSKFGTVLPQAVAARHLDPVAMFPTPPEVTYIDGLLTIGAHNAPLAAVLEVADALEAVAGQTGSAVDIPPPAELERIREHTAQAQDDDLLSRLLKGSAFDFVIAGSSCSSSESLRPTWPLRQAIPVKVRLIRREAAQRSEAKVNGGLPGQRRGDSKRVALLWARVWLRHGVLATAGGSDTRT